MARLPLLRGKLAFGYLQELPIIFRRLLECFQVVVAGSAQKICAGVVGNELSPRLQGLQRKLVMLVLRSYEGQIAVAFGQFGIELYRLDEFCLRLRKLALIHEQRSTRKANVSVVRLGLRQFAIKSFSDIVLLAERRRVRQLTFGISV